MDRDLITRWERLAQSRGVRAHPRIALDEQAPSDPNWSKDGWRAREMVNDAIERGEMRRANACDVCGAAHENVVGHHWRGYDYPLDVWWVCPSCHACLRGQSMHKGLLTLEEARKMVADIRKGGIYGFAHKRKAPAS